MLSDKLLQTLPYLQYCPCAQSVAREHSWADMDSSGYPLALLPNVLSVESNVTSPDQLGGKFAIALGSEPPPLTRIARIGLGTRLVSSLLGVISMAWPSQSISALTERI